MTRKYEFTGEEQQNFGRTLKRIRRISDGLVGGWIERENNLSQDGTCFIYDNACVYDNARVSDYARVFGNVCVSGNARIYGKARIFDNACVFDKARVSGDARIYGKARIFDNACVFNNTRVSGDARVYGKARVFGHAYVSGGARVSGDARVFGNMVCTEAVMCANLYRYTVTCSDSHISVGCEVHTFEVWKEHGERIAKEDGFSDGEIELYKSIVLGMIAYREGVNEQEVESRQV